PAFSSHFSYLVRVLPFGGQKSAVPWSSAKGFSIESGRQKVPMPNGFGTSMRGVSAFLKGSHSLRRMSGWSCEAFLNVRFETEISLYIFGYRSIGQCRLPYLAVTGTQKKKLLLVAATSSASEQCGRNFA